MGKADLHVHTCHDSWGDGNQSVEELFRYVEQETDLDLFGVTDHDSSDAARLASAIHRAGRYRFDLLPGVEVTNRAGHLLCYFPSGEVADIPSLRSFWWTVDYARERGAICIVAHPIYPPWLLRVLYRGLAQGRKIDGIESVNASLSEAGQERLALALSNLPGTAARLGNSDAHDQSAIGSAYTEFAGSSRQDFLDALRSCQTRPVLLGRPQVSRESRSFTTRRSMTRPAWIRNLWRQAAGQHR